MGAAWAWASGPPPAMIAPARATVAIPVRVSVLNIRASSGLRPAGSAGVLPANNHRDSPSGPGVSSRLRWSVVLAMVRYRYRYRYRAPGQREYSLAIVYSNAASVLPETI